MRIAGAAAAKPHPRQQRLDPLPPRAPVEAPQAEADIAGDRHVGEEREVLEHHADAARLGR